MEIPLLLWNMKVQYRVHKRPQQELTLNQKNPIHIFSCGLTEMEFSVIVSAANTVALNGGHMAPQAAMLYF
jgi:hypothetical protein